IHLIEIPSDIFAEYRSLPLPIPFVSEAVSMGGKIKEILFSIVFYVPPMIFLFTLIQLVSARKSKKENIRSIPYIIKMLILIAGTLMYSQALIRSDAEHVMPSMIFAMLLLPSIFENVKINKFRIVLTLSVSLFLMLLPSLNKAQTLSKIYLSSDSYELTADKASGVVVDREWGENFDEMISFMQSEIPAEEKIYVGNYSHDRILLNDIMIYYISGRASGTKYHELHPGVSTTKPVQKEMIEELKNNSVNYIVLCDNNEFLEPNKSSISSGVHLLDEYIAENYRELKTFGGYKILILAK
ncbi:MAG: hypothetical protein KAH48_00440, partial [Chlorobi bacterium]|nr:hypothetical protein [Chlorobiota bacterium]